MNSQPFHNETLTSKSKKHTINKIRELIIIINSHYASLDNIIIIKESYQSFGGRILYGNSRADSPDG